MKNKIKYFDISDEALSIVIGECYGLGDYTLKDELDKYGQDIIYAIYYLKDSGHGKYFEFFHAWTKDYALVLIDSPFNDKVILGLTRNPPGEMEITYERKTKRKTRRK